MSGLRRNREFVALWLGQAVSNLGISISSFAYPLVVLAATGSPAKAGLVGSVLAGTAFVLRIPAGYLVDRWNRRTILLVCDAGRALNAAAFAVALALGHFFFAQVLAVAFVEAALGVLFGPAESAAVRRVVPPEQLRDAVAQNQSRAAIPGLLGPPLGGVLLTVSRALPFVADAVSYLVSFLCVASVRTPLGSGAAESARPFDVFAGLRWVWAHRYLRDLLLWLLGVATLFSSIGLVMLVVARERGASSAELGAMFAITSAGGVVGSLIAPWMLRHARPLSLVLGLGVLSTVACFLLAVVDSPYLIGALGAAAFLLYPPVNAMGLATLTAESDEAMLGRATSAAIQIASLGAPVGPVLAGLLLSAFRPTAVVLGYAVALFVLAVGALASPALRSA